MSADLALSDLNAEPGSPEDSHTLAKKSGEVTPLKDTSQQYFPQGPVPPIQQDNSLKNIIIGISVFSAGITLALIIQLAAGGPQVEPHGGVSSCSEICSKIGLDILKEDGNAVDAAISTMLCVGITNPQYAGLGGGGFMLVHDHRNSHQSHLFDFREKAPSDASIDTESNQLIHKVGVPGEVMGMFESHKILGKLEWSQLFKPVIKLARDGFPLPYAFVHSRDKRLKNYQATEVNEKQEFENFMHKFGQNFAGGKELVEGTFVKRHDLANVLEKIGQIGPSYFYGGQIAAEINKATGGFITVDDLKNFTVRRPQAIKSSYKNVTVETFPAPASGGMLLLILNLMELEDVSMWSKQAPTEKESDYFNKLRNAVSDSIRFRNRLGDVSEEVSKLEAALINKKCAVSLREAGVSAKECDILKPTPPPDPNSVHKRSFQFEDHGTSHVSVIDSDDLMVSVTHTINTWFGSLQMTESGILLNDQLNDFSPGISNNNMAANKAPLSSMVPSVIYHDSHACRDRIATGGANGTRIVTGVASMMSHYLFLHRSIDDAMVLPRVHCSFVEDESVCQIEDPDNDLPEQVKDKFSGGQVHTTSVIETVMKHNHSVFAFADERVKGGLGITY